MMRVEWWTWLCVVVGGFDGASESISDEAMCDDFALCTIILCGEGEGYKSGSLKVGFRALYWIDGPVVNVEFHVSETKGCIVRGSTRVLARAKKEVKCDGDDVGGGLLILGGRVPVGLMADEDDYDDYDDWDWFYTGGGVSSLR
jgi:hypothetical protein